MDYYSFSEACYKGNHFFSFYVCLFLKKKKREKREEKGFVCMIVKKKLKLVLKHISAGIKNPLIFIQDFFFL